MLKKIRIILATLMFTGITLLFLDFTGTLHHWLAWMAEIQFLPSILALNGAITIVLVVLTLVFGRIYCSIICPLGVMQDIIGWIGKKKKHNRYSYSREVKWLRYPVLVLYVAASIAGIGSVMALLEPYSSYGRMATMLFQPLYLWGNNVLAAIAEHYDSYAFYSVEVWMRSLPTLIIAAVSFALITFLAWRGGRTYCNTVCPVGTILSFLARFSLLKIRFDKEKCRNCSLCTKNCKAACIDYKNHSVDYSRCVVCGDCLSKCKFGALKYERPKKSERLNHLEKSDSTHHSSPTAEGRRSFLLSSALMTTAMLAQDKKKVDGGLATIEDKAIPNRQTPLTPPGSMSAQHFAQICTGCQICVSDCPNDVLRPSSDLLKLMQPTMSFERGFCRPECTRCSEVCPTDAIRPFTPAQKSATQIGHAVWIKKNCLVLTDGVACGNCARHCPTGAIEMVPSDSNDDESPFVPAVNEAVCIGCGACENLCPARPFPAIYVEGHEVHREI
ncbi:MAG: 4Fe-4S binding protein [Prevotella sp.]|nr:4Fe-4S binding protein [Prevotella sp.]